MSARDRAARALVRQLLLTLPQPVLSVVYLALVRAQLVAPSFVPLLLLAAFPLASAITGLVARRDLDQRQRTRSTLLLVAALLELLWTGLAEAMIGFAIAWRSG